MAVAGAGRLRDTNFVEAVNQRHLEDVVTRLFPGHNILSNTRKDATIINPATNRPFELDVWLPDLKLCFEFQDDHHYVTTWYSHLSLDKVKEKDDWKQHTVREKETTLIVVPNWWDITSESLAATICFERPDLQSVLHPSVVPIPLNPPSHFLAGGSVPDVGELMYASFPPDISAFSIDQLSEEAWWMGEKYDGLRVCWNEKRSTLYSRSGLELELPDSVREEMPVSFLDGETWFGRGSFSESQVLVNTSNVDWRSFRLIVFDKPDIKTQGLSFEERYALLLRAIPQDHQFVILSPRVNLESTKHLSTTLDEIIKDGGEGVIVRKHNSHYESGRNTALWKLKATRGDMEALVVEVGVENCLLQIPSGTEFSVNFENFDDDIEPKRGDVVTFAYDNFSNTSVPINPTVYRIREDLTWRDVVRDYVSQLATAQSLTANSNTVTKFSAKPFGYWNYKKNNNMRDFFENFAKAKNLDPLIPNTWYTLASELTIQKEAKHLLAQFNGSLVKALMNIFPDIGLKETNFPITPHYYWASVDRRRQFFIQFAEHRKFDPLVAGNWYSQPIYTVLLYKNMRSILELYGGSFSRALVHIFPDIGLDHRKLPVVPDKFWYSRIYQKEFVNFSRSNDNDLVTSGEDSLPISMDTFSLLQQKARHSSNFWSKQRNQREFFNEFAKDKCFDPLVAANWYSVTSSALKSYIGANSVLSYYDGNLIKALSAAYPEIGLDQTKFHKAPKKHWHNKHNQRAFFDTFAQERGFDPLIASNWANRKKRNFIQIGS